MVYVLNAYIFIKSQRPANFDNFNLLKGMYGFDTTSINNTFF